MRIPMLNFDANMTEESNRILEYCRDKAANANPVNELHCKLCSQTFQGDGMFLESLIHLKTSHSGVFESQQNNISSSSEVSKAVHVEPEVTNNHVSSSLDDVELVVVEDEEIQEVEEETKVVKKLDQTTQTPHKTTEKFTQTNFSIPLPIPEPLKKFLCMTESPGACEPYECLICNHPISNLKVAVIHLFQKHNINLRREAPKTAMTTSLPSPQQHVAQCASISNRRTARKSISSRTSNSKNSSTTNARTLVDQVLSTLPSVQDSAREYYKNLTSLVTSQRVTMRESSVQLSKLKSSRLQSIDDSSDDFEEEISPLKVNPCRRRSTDSDVSMVAKKTPKKCSPVKANVKKLTSSGGKNRHLLTKEKRAMFSKTLPNRGKVSKRDKLRLAKKKKMHEALLRSNQQSPVKAGNTFPWSEVCFNSTANKVEGKDQPPAKLKNTARKSIRPIMPSSPDIADVVHRDVNDDIIGNSRFFIRKTPEAVDDVTGKYEYHHDNMECLVTPTTLSSSVDVTTTAQKVKNRSGRKSIRSKMD